MEENATGSNQIHLLRKFFTIGLRTRLHPITQRTFADWCDMSPDSLASIETGRMNISDAVAERIYRISGAPRDWLEGRLPYGSYTYDSLQRWFPISFRQRPTLLMGAGAARSGTTTYLSCVLEPALRYMLSPYRNCSQGDIRGLLDQLLSLLPPPGGAESSTHSMTLELLWPAYAFLQQSTDLELPFKMGLLTPVVEEAEKLGHVIAAGDYRKLQHFVLFLRGKHEREEHALLEKTGSTTAKGDEPVP